MREAGRFAAKARKMASEFTAAFDQMAREAEMEELRKEIDDLKKNNPVADAKRAFDDVANPIKKDLDSELGDIKKAAEEKPAQDTHGGNEKNEAAAHERRADEN